MPVLILQILLVSSSSYLFAAYFSNIRRLAEFIIVWFVLFFAQIILVELSLGIASQLYSPYILAAHILVFLIAVLLPREKPAFDLIKPHIEVVLNNRLLVLAFSVVACFSLVKIFINLITPPVSPDSLQFHLSFPATWIRNGNLNNPILIFMSSPTDPARSLELSSCSYYPINAQLFFAWLMFPLRNAFLADVGEFPFYLVGIVGIFAILRRYNIGKETALLSGFLWALIPNIFKQLRTASQIDIICAVMFLLVIYAILMLQERFDLRRAIFLGITTGIFLGIKIINIVWFMAALPLFFYVLYSSARMVRPAKSLLLIGSMALMVFLFAGFMYVKNFMYTGNPLFPVDLRVAGITVFKGLMDNVAYKALMADDKFDMFRIAFAEGLGLQFLGLVLAGLVIPVLFFRHIMVKARPVAGYILLYVTPVLMFILYARLIDVYAVRYLFPYVSMGLISAIVFINLMPWGERYFQIIAFLSILMSAAELGHAQELIVSFALSGLLILSLFLFKKEIVTFYYGRFFKTLVVSSLLGVLLLSGLNVWYDRHEFERYPLTISRKESWQRDIVKGWQKLNDLTGSGSRVAYTGRQEFYQFYGNGIKNEVRYISINSQEVSPYNKFDGRFRKVRDFSAWKENLRKERIEYLFVALPFFTNRESEDPAKFPIEQEWAAAHPESFTEVFKNSLSYIYKVRL